LWLVCGLDDLRGSNVNRDKTFSLLQNIWMGSSAHWASYSEWVLGFFSGSIVAGCEVDYSSPSSAKVKNKWNYTSAPLIWLHGMDKDNFIFYTRKSLCL
jgi:hypothetical protein